MIGTSGYFTKVFYIQPYLSFLNGSTATTGYSGSMMLIVISGIVAITGILFIAANVVRVIVVLLQKPEQKSEIYQFPKFYYPYVLIFTLLALGIGIVGILGFNGISPVLDNYNIINIF